MASRRTTTSAIQSFRRVVGPEKKGPRRRFVTRTADQARLLSPQPDDADPTHMSIEGAHGQPTLSGKTLFITGASRGIGLAIALRAARDGANIAIAAKTAEPHRHLPGTIYTAATEIEAAGGRALPLIVDVRDEAAVLRAVEAT